MRVCGYGGCGRARMGWRERAGRRLLGGALRLERVAVWGLGLCGWLVE